MPQAPDVANLVGCITLDASYVDLVSGAEGLPHPALRAAAPVEGVLELRPRMVSTRCSIACSHGRFCTARKTMHLGVEETDRLWRIRRGSGLQTRYFDVTCVEYLHRCVYCGQVRRGRGDCHWLCKSSRWSLICDDSRLAP